MAFGTNALKLRSSIQKNVCDRVFASAVQAQNFLRRNNADFVVCEPHVAQAQPHRSRNNQHIPSYFTQLSLSFGLPPVARRVHPM